MQKHAQCRNYVLKLASNHYLLSLPKLSFQLGDAHSSAPAGAEMGCSKLKCENAPFVSLVCVLCSHLQGDKAIKPQFFTEAADLRVLHSQVVAKWSPSGRHSKRDGHLYVAMFSNPVRSWVGHFTRLYPIRNQHETTNEDPSSNRCIVRV